MKSFTLILMAILVVMFSSADALAQDPKTPADLQRLAKDYPGAATLVPYFLLTLAAIYLLAQ